MRLNLVEARDEEAALAHLHRENLTDGLPVIIPTVRRVDEMMLASGYEGDVVLGVAGPSQAAATVEAAAINAVMAGCLPEYFPVVLAAVKAICDEQFDLTELQVTTHAVTPLLIVNGPARHQCGLASGFGAFGPGQRANATIGRALRLFMMNIGGGRPGVSDMALFGHPAKFTFCAAENEEASPFPPLHVALGFSVSQSTVTAVGVEGPHSVVCAPVPDADVEQAAAAAINAIASAVGAPGSNSSYRGTGSIVVVLNPSLAKRLAAAGYERLRIQKELVDHARHPRGLLRKLNPGMIGPGDDEELVPERDPETILLFVAGGEGAYAMVCPSLGIGPHSHNTVTKEIELNHVCELPARTLL